MVNELFCFNVTCIYRLDNDKLKLLVKKKDDDLLAAKGAVERFTNAV